MVREIGTQNLYQSTPLVELSTNMQKFSAGDEFEFFRNHRGDPLVSNLGRKIFLPEIVGSLTPGLNLSLPELRLRA